MKTDIIGYLLHYFIQSLNLNAHIFVRYVGALLGFIKHI